MTVTVIVATSLDGFIADSSGTTIPVSKEDTAFLKQQLAVHDAHVMGATTYKSVEQMLTPRHSNKRYVLTSTPDLYKHSNLATFVTIPLPQLLLQLKKQSIKNVLILGGNSLYEACLQNDLADVVYVTVEPSKMQNGVPFLANPAVLQKHYVLLQKQKLNTSGTTLYTYTKTHL